MTARFPLTDWPLVAASRQPSPSPDCEPLAEICSRYWYPVYAFLRRRGHRPDDAEDLTQGFFTHLIANRVLERASPERGRLRSLLLACLTNFVANEQDRLRAIKRGGALTERLRPSIDRRDMCEPADHMTPERVYELQWTIVLLRRVLEELRAELAASGKEQVFTALRSHLVGDGTTTGYREAAAALNMSEGTARVTVHRLRRRYRTLLWTEVARTLPGPDQDVAGEIRYLLAVMQGPPAQGVES